jgi:TPP-dependent pyruvate/acetoin dehydrogenase alpha subunit
MTKVASFEIHYTQFLDASGNAVAELPEFARDSETLIELYRAMVLTRRFDAKAVALQRTGRLRFSDQRADRQPVSARGRCRLRQDAEARARWRGLRLR